MKAKIVGAVIRALLTGSAGALALNGAVTEDNIEVLAAAITTVVTLGWSIWEKYKSVKKEV